MFAIALAAVLATAPTFAPPAAPASPLPTTTSAIVTTDDPADSVLTRARAAEARGDLDAALQEYRRAVRLHRAEGILPVAASYGAANVLTQQSKRRDAATVLEQLAADANLLGDANTEAQVLLDLVSLKMSDRRRAAARPDALRLQELVTDVRLTAETRRLIRTRLT